MSLSLGLNISLGASSSSSSGGGGGSFPSADDIDDLSPSVWHKSEQIVGSGSSVTGAWVDATGGSQFGIPSSASDRPEYIASDSDFNNQSTVKFTSGGQHYRKDGTTGYSGDHWFLCFSWWDTSNNTSGLGYGGALLNNPWSSTHRLDIIDTTWHILNGTTYNNFRGITESTAKFNASGTICRKNGQHLNTTNKKKYTPIPNIRNTDGTTWVSPSYQQTHTVNNISEWDLPVLYEFETDGSSGLAPRWLGQYSTAQMPKVKFAELLAFTNPLSTSDASTVRSYFHGKFGTDVTQ
jgi:hypothetical protein